MARGRDAGDDMFGSEDNWGEDDDELGIDYLLIDHGVEDAMGEGRAPIIEMGSSDFRQGNPAPVQKVLQKRFTDVKVDRIHRIAVITFEDGSTLTIRP